MKKKPTYTDFELFQFYIESKKVHDPKYMHSTITKNYLKAVNNGLTIEQITEGYDRYMSSNGLPTSNMIGKKIGGRPSKFNEESVTVRVPKGFVPELNKQLEKYLNSKK